MHGRRFLNAELRSSVDGFSIRSGVSSWPFKAKPIKVVIPGIIARLNPPGTVVALTLGVGLPIIVGERMRHVHIHKNLIDGGFICIGVLLLCRRRAALIRRHC